MKKLINNLNPFILLLVPVFFALIMGVSYEFHQHSIIHLARNAEQATSLFSKSVDLFKTVCSVARERTMVIRTEGLTFKFAHQTVVKSLSLEVPEGSIYGFLGPMAPGKLPLSNY